MAVRCGAPDGHLHWMHLDTLDWKQKYLQLDIHMVARLTNRSGWRIFRYFVDDISKNASQRQCLRCNIRVYRTINPLYAELNPIYHLLALIVHPIFHISRIRVNSVCHMYYIAGKWELLTRRWSTIRLSSHTDRKLNPHTSHNENDSNAFNDNKLNSVQCSLL